MMQREYALVYINQINENEHRMFIQKQSKNKQNKKNKKNKKKRKKAKLLMHLLLVSK